MKKWIVGEAEFPLPQSVDKFSEQDAKRSAVVSRGSASVNANTA
jgi:hypothetical protein